MARQRSNSLFFFINLVQVLVVMIILVIAWKDVQWHELAKQDPFQRLDFFHECHDILHLPVERDHFGAIFLGDVDVHGRMQLDAGIVFQFRELVEQPALVVVERDDEKAVLETFKARGRLFFQELAQRIPHDLGPLGSVLLAISLEFSEKTLRDRDRDAVHVFFRVHGDHLIYQFPRG